MNKTFQQLALLLKFSSLFSAITNILHKKLEAAAAFKQGGVEYVVIICKRGLSDEETLTNAKVTLDNGVIGPF